MHVQRRFALYLLVLFTVFCGGGASKAPSASPSASPQKLALLVGIDKYRNVTNLSGCVNDVENMKSLLVTRFEFPEENILVLKNEQATRKGILNAFQNHLVARAQPGDVVVLHYSGHGSQMKDKSGDEVDGWDETLVPHDSREGMVYDVSDDELNGLLDKLAQKTENITLILDSCHSGTATRAAGLVRLAPRDERPAPDPEPFAIGTRSVDDTNDVRPSDSKYVLLTGSRSSEVSFEYRAEGQSHGALTYFLTQELRAAGAGATYRDVMDKVAGKVSAAYPGQHPTLEGAKADNFVFGDASALAEPHVRVSPRGGSMVALEAGEVQGVTQGSLFDVYKPGTKTFSDPEKPIARVEVTKVDTFTSEARLASPGAVSEASRAVERVHEYPDRKLIVHYMGLAKSPTLASVKAELDQLKFIETARDAAGYHLLLRHDETRKAIITEGGDPSELSPPVPVSEPDAVTHVVDQVKQWARWFNVLSIVNRAPELKVKFTVQVVKDGRARSPFTRADQVDVVLGVGDEFEIAVENASGRDLYLAILDLESSGSITQVFPTVAGAAELLSAGGTWKKTFKTTLPDGRDSIRDILKVFATASPVDLTPLYQPAVRSVGRKAKNKDPFGQLLESAATGATRGITGVDTASWVTAERVIEVRKKTTS